MRDTGRGGGPPRRLRNDDEPWWFPSGSGSLITFRWWSRVEFEGSVTAGAAGPAWVGGRWSEATVLWSRGVWPVASGGPAGSGLCRPADSERRLSESVVVTLRHWQRASARLSHCRERPGRVAHGSVHCSSHSKLQVELEGSLTPAVSLRNRAPPVSRARARVSLL